jgi:hypothetical protein
MSEQTIDLMADGDVTAEVKSEILAPTALEAIQRAEVDIAIATAKRYPRDIARSLKTCKELALRNPAIARRCNYAVPRAGKKIIGPSVHFARIVAYSWGNATALSRVVGCDHDNAHIQGVFHDLQTNLRIGIEMDWPVQAPHDPTAERWKDQMTLAKRAGAAVGLRTAIFNVIPMVLFDAIAEEAKMVAVGDAKTFEDRRSNALAECKKLGVTQGMVYRTLERNGLEAITTDDLIYLHGLLASVADNTLTVFQAFGPPEKETVAAQVPKPRSRQAPAENRAEPPPPEPETKKPNAETEEPKRETPPEPASQAGPASETPPEPQQEAPPPPPPPAKKEKKGEVKPEKKADLPNPIESIRANLAEAKVSEGQLISWLNDIGTVPDGTTKLEQVNAKWLKMVLDDWPGILDQVNAFLQSPAANFP